MPIHDRNEFYLLELEAAGEEEGIDPSSRASSKTEPDFRLSVEEELPLGIEELLHWRPARFWTCVFAFFVVGKYPAIYTYLSVQQGLPLGEILLGSPLAMATTGLEAVLLPLALYFYGRHRLALWRITRHYEDTYGVTPYWYPVRRAKEIYWYWKRELERDDDIDLDDDVDLHADDDVDKG